MIRVLTVTRPTLMIAAGLLLVVCCATTRPDSFALERPLVSLHERSWLEITPLIAEELMHKSMVLIDDSSPDCNGDLYFSDNVRETDRHIWLRFTKISNSSGNCVQELSSVSVWSDFPTPSDAERARKVLVMRLKAGSLPVISAAQRDYTWRSEDARTLYNLFTNISSLDGRSRLSVRLIHTQAMPSTVKMFPPPSPQ